MPIRSLQAAVRAAAEHVAPGSKPRRVVIYDDEGRKILDATVPECACLPGRLIIATVVAGWRVSEHEATYDGNPIAVAPSRLRLLKVFVDATHPLTSKELTALAFDQHTDDANTRYHIRELKKEITKAFAFDGDVILGDNDGYRLVLR